MIDVARSLRTAARCAAAGLAAALALAVPASAQDPAGRAPAPKEAPPSVLVDLGNAACPVMGGKPDGKTWSEWKGLRVGHCCPGCVKAFAKDPGAALAKAGIEWKGAAEAVAKVEVAKTSEDRAKALEALGARWKVIRPAPKAEGLLVDLGNAACPVMGGKPDGKTWSEWKGLRVGHCCPGCVKAFAKDPEGALKKAGIEWRAAAEAVTRVEAAKTPGDRAKALEALAAKWTVVRDPEAKPAPAEKPEGKPVEPAPAK